MQKGRSNDCCGPLCHTDAKRTSGVQGHLQGRLGGVQWRRLWGRPLPPVVGLAGECTPNTALVSHLTTATLLRSTVHFTTVLG